MGFFGRKGRKSISTAQVRSTAKRLSIPIKTKGKFITVKSRGDAGRLARATGIRISSSKRKK